MTSKRSYQSRKAGQKPVSSIAGCLCCVFKTTSTRSALVAPTGLGMPQVASRRKIAAGIAERQLQADPGRKPPAAVGSRRPLTNGMPRLSQSNPREVSQSSTMLATSSLFYRPSARDCCRRCPAAEDRSASRRIPPPRAHRASARRRPRAAPEGVVLPVVAPDEEVWHSLQRCRIRMRRIGAPEGSTARPHARDLAPRARPQSRNCRPGCAPARRRRDRDAEMSASYAACVGTSLQPQRGTPCARNASNASTGNLQPGYVRRSAGSRCHEPHGPNGRYPPTHPWPCGRTAPPDRPADRAPTMRGRARRRLNVGIETGAEEERLPAGTSVRVDSQRAPVMPPPCHMSIGARARGEASRELDVHLPGDDLAVGSS